MDTGQRSLSWEKRTHFACRVDEDGLDMRGYFVPTQYCLLSLLSLRRIQVLLSSWLSWEGICQPNHYVISRKSPIRESYYSGIQEVFLARRVNLEIIKRCSEKLEGYWRLNGLPAMHYTHCDTVRNVSVP